MLRDSVGTNSIVNHSKFLVEVDSLVLNPKYRGLPNDSLGLCVSSKGVLKHYEGFIPSSSTPTTLTIPTDSLPTGIAQLTLFNREGRVLADRLTFIQNQGVEQHRVTISGMPQECNPYQEVSFTVNAQQGGTVSLAVRDQATSDYLYDDANFLTEQLLCSQIKGFVEHPNYYFEADDAMHRQHLDLLLMVQGWRRYSWTDMTSQFTLRQPYEQYRVLKGEVYKYDELEKEDYFQVVHENIQVKNPGGSAGPKLEEFLSLVIPADSNEVGPPSGMTVINGSDFNYNTYNGRYAMLNNLRFVSSATDSEDASGVFYYDNKMNDPSTNQSISPIKDNVLLHAEFTQPKQEGVVGDMTVQDGKFSITAPEFENYCFFFLTAAKERKKEQTAWINTAPDAMPEYYVRLNQFYPRFVKPYNYYQTLLAPVPESAAKAASSTRKQSPFETDMREVSIRAKRTGLRGFNANHPAFVMDAYEAVNAVYDAGLLPGVYSGFLSFSIQYARLLVGDMGVDRSYSLDRRWNDKDISNNMARNIGFLYNHLENLDCVKVFTDYAPRMEGDPRYEGSTQPTVTVDMLRYADDSVRPIWRDRQYVLPGYNICDEFYHPNYSKKPLPSTKDYRRTLYWNPDLQLDKNGRASVKFYNNSRMTFPIVSAEGLTDQGEVLSTIP